jgi:hypothetical protein
MDLGCVVMQWCLVSCKTDVVRGGEKLVKVSHLTHTKSNKILSTYPQGLMYGSLTAGASAVTRYVVPTSASTSYKRLNG